MRCSRFFSTSWCFLLKKKHNKKKQAVNYQYFYCTFSSQVQLSSGFHHLSCDFLFGSHPGRFLAFLWVLSFRFNFSNHILRMFLFLSYNHNTLRYCALQVTCQQQVFVVDWVLLWLTQPIYVCPGQISHKASIYMESQL